MRRFLLPGILAVFTLFLPSRSQAVPMDVPYFQVVDGTATTSVQLSTFTFPVATSSGTVAYGWCIDHLTVSVGNGIVSTFTMFYSTGSVANSSSQMIGTTNYVVVTSSSQPFDTQFSYRTPYCAPPGNYLTLIDNVAGALISYEGYIWGGWNKP